MATGIPFFRASRQAKPAPLPSVRQSGIIWTTRSEITNNEKSEPDGDDRLRRHRRAGELRQGGQAAWRLAVVLERKPARARRAARGPPDQPHHAQRRFDGSRRAAAGALASAAR